MAPLSLGTFKTKTVSMQPKFTRKALESLFSRLAVVILVSFLTLSLQAQKDAKQPSNPNTVQKATADQEALRQAKQNLIQASKSNINPVSVSNDAGVVNRNVSTSVVARTEAICATYNGSLGPGDATMNFRPFRDGTASVCGPVKPCTNGLSAAGTFYDVYTFTNPLATSQCVTVSFTNGAAAFANFVAVYQSPFVPPTSAAGFCTGNTFLGDIGGSTGGGATSSFSFTIPGAASVDIVVAALGAVTTPSYTLVIDAPVCFAAPCTGTPAPGNTISNDPDNTVCPGVPFTLSLQNATTGSGVTYQWQSAPSVSGPWTNISGATFPSYTTNIATATAYRCQVTCSAGPNTGTSNPLLININPPSACYCTPTYANGCTLGDFISNVTLGTLNNTSACSTPPFTYYSAVPAPVLVQGGTYPVRVTVGPDTFGQFVRVWVDWNQDGDFTDAGEAVGVSGNVGANGTAVINMTVPPTALLGTTRMRVRGGDDSAPTAAQSCGAANSSFGEAEDYNVTIQPCIPITFTSQPSSATITCGNNASFSVGVAGSVPAYIWEYRVNASSPWQFVPNSAPFSGVNTSTLTLTNVSQAYNGYQFRAIVSGACTAFDFSNTVTLTVNAIVPVVNPSSATICVGSVQQLTLTNTLGNADLINEGFNVVSPLPAGWAAQNLSTTVGTTGWFQGNTSVFPAQSGPADSYIGANFNNTTGANTISNWLFTPNINMKNGDVFTFWTRTVSPATFPDRLEVRLSTNGASTNAGATSASVGDFTTLLLSVNPTLTTTGYPTAWTQYTINLSGLPAGITSGRIAFRYFVTNGGPAGANSDYIGIDNVVYTSTGGPAQGIWGGPAGTIYSDAGATITYTGTPATTVWVKPTATGVNNYTVNFTTLTPCTSATTTVPVTVHSPVTGIAVSPSTFSVCLGSSRTLTASTTGGTPVNYQWQVSVDGGVTYSNISGATSSTYTVASVTSAMNGNRYRVTTTGNVCGTYTSTPSVLTVLALPTVSITSPVTQLVPGRTTSITGTSTPAPLNATSWSWTYNGSPLVTTPASNTNTISGINIDRIGSYRATVTDVNGCTNNSNTLVIGTEASDRLWIYPNPTTGAFQVRLYYGSDVAEKRAVHIYNELGQIIMTKEFNLVTETPDYLQMDFDLSKQARGVYVVKVVNKYAGTIVSGLVIKQ